ncbi:Holliday junction recognition protein isoform X2 [Rhineura floridana]|uniref:Holliday junction recognition protein isoform X2 n=1 Tax=Rhineura floridana TaxID=261503 RepID=UPI002AC814EA|nr:Holliday junction recognition protein isoform X2 [Rhineura floridana]
MNPRGRGKDGDSSINMDRRFRHSSLRFASAMSSIVEKYNFPFDDDDMVSIKSLTYDTPEGPKVWGEEPSAEIIDRPYQNNVQCQENKEMERQKTSDFDSEDYEDYQSSEEEQFMNSCGESQLDTDHRSNAELISIKRHLENIHIKEHIPLVCCSGTLAKKKYKVEMDVLLEDGANLVPKLITVTRPKANNVYQFPLQELEDESLIGHRDMFLKKQAQSTNGNPASLSPQLSNSAAPGSTNEATVSENHSVGGDNETVYSSFLEMYESADEHCSWNNVTIADLYPGMVKALSRLLHKVSRKTSSNSLNKRYRYGHCHPKKTKLNTSTDRVKKSIPLKLKSNLMMTEDDLKRDKLSMGNNRRTSPFYDGKHQMQCSVNNISRAVSSIHCNADRMEMDSGILDDHSYTERVRLNDTETTIFSRALSTEETFLDGSPSCIPSSSDFGRKGQTFEQYSPTICTVDTGATFNLAADDKTGEMSTMTFKATSCLSLSLNGGTSSYLHSNTSSPVKMSNMLLGNHEIKRFNKAISLQRSHSFSSLPVNCGSIKTHQTCEDAFEKMYKELCCPKLQKPYKFSTICTSPRKSSELCKSGFNSLSSNFHQNMIENIYQKLCSEGLPKIPTFLRAASLKKYEGIQMSDTVNALVNSPIRTLPAVARIKRAANFCNEDSQSSPFKRLKNISENSYRISQKLPPWKNDLRKTDMTFTLHTPTANNWTSNMDSRFCVSSNHSYLAVPSTCIKESRITDADVSIPKFVQNNDSPRKSQNWTSGAASFLRNTVLAPE